MAVLNPTMLQCPEHMFLHLPIMYTVYSACDYTVRIHPVAMVAVFVFVCDYRWSGNSRNETTSCHILCCQYFQNTFLLETHMPPGIIISLLGNLQFQYLYTGIVSVFSHLVAWKPSMNTWSIMHVVWETGEDNITLTTRHYCKCIIAFQQE